MKRMLLVTGCYRSGTTIAEKLLDQHPRVCVSSQPMPVLYHLIKQRFLEELGVQRRYPLGHGFGETAYADGDFAAFLNRYRVDDRDLSAFWDGLSGYGKGHWTPEIFELRDRVMPGPFAEVYRALLEGTAALIGGGDVAGSKEILVEEYAPWVLDQGGAVVLSLRDPRDLITSLDFRQRDTTTGRPRPLLFDLRIWRKSVRFAFALEGRPGFAWHRYEDLVSDPDPVRARWASALGVEAFGPVDTIRDRDGGIWRSNSAFEAEEGVSTAPVGRFADVLPDRTLRYIEAICGPEMDALGYARVTDAAASMDELAGYEETFAEVHAAFPADYSRDPERLLAEINR